MKKILFSLFLFLILTSCSENKKDSITQLIETCADNRIMKWVNVDTENGGKDRWLKIHKPKVIEYLEKNLQDKLKTPLKYEYKDYSNKNVHVSYEVLFNRCEIDNNKYPVKFKAKWENQKIK